MNITTNSEQQTINFGKQLSRQLTGGDILLLKGELGAGKTTLVKGMALGLGIKEEITSPTFTLMNIHYVRNTKATKIRTDTKKFLAHIDTYRLKNEQELVEIGVEDYLGDKNCVCVVEWPEKLKTLLKNIRPRRIISVDIEHGEKNRRRISMSGV